ETLWRDYAAHGQGYCLGFSFDPPWGYTDPETGKTIRLYPYPVTYQDDYPIVDPDLLDTKSQQEQFAKAAIITKNTKWASEKEWRCFRPSILAGIQPFPEAALTQIIFGDAVTTDSRNLLVRLATVRKHPPALLQAVRTADNHILIEPFAL